MPCKQSELITAINSFAAARSSSDQVLTNFSANLVAKLMDTLQFDPEELPQEEEEVAAPEVVEATDEKPAEIPEAVFSTVEKTDAPVLKDPPVKKTRKRSSANV
jgi:hypothetical protein